jgi:hypothetical protein
MRSLEGADRFGITFRQIFLGRCFCHFSFGMLLNPFSHVSIWCLCLVQHTDKPDFFLQLFTGGAQGLLICEAMESSSKL